MLGILLVLVFLQSNDLNLLRKRSAPAAFRDIEDNVPVLMVNEVAVPDEQTAVVVTTAAEQQQQLPRRSKSLVARLGRSNNRLEQLRQKQQELMELEVIQEVSSSCNSSTTAVQQQQQQQQQQQKVRKSLKDIKEEVLSHSHNEDEIKALIADDESSGVGIMVSRKNSEDSAKPNGKQVRYFDKRSTADNFDNSSDSGCVSTSSDNRGGGQQGQHHQRVSKSPIGSSNSQEKRYFKTFILLTFCSSFICAHEYQNENCFDNAIEKGSFGKKILQRCLRHL